MRTKRCEIIPEQCIACGLCALYAPDIFDYDDEGIVLFKQEKEANHQYIPNEAYSSVLQAYQKCPVRAILLEK